MCRAAFVILVFFFAVVATVYLDGESPSWPVDCWECKRCAAQVWCCHLWQPNRLLLQLLTFRKFLLSIVNPLLLDLVYNLCPLTNWPPTHQLTDWRDSGSWGWLVGHPVLCMVKIIDSTIDTVRICVFLLIGKSTQSPIWNWMPINSLDQMAGCAGFR